MYRVRSALSHRFKGGVHAPHHKDTRNMAIEKLAPSKIMIYPLSQHIGAACEPLVKPGDIVKIGQKIADTDAFVSAPVHASVSGKVLKVDFMPHPTLNKALAIVVENDFEDTIHESVQNIHRDYKEMSNEDIISVIREAGITGMGGASFPTHVKIQSALKDNIDTLIINAAECEPYLSNDNRMMLEATEELIGGIKILCKVFGLKGAHIGIESNKPKAIRVLSRATHKTRIKVTVLHAKYPQGGEKQLIKAVCNRTVPSGKLPSSVGCTIFNVDTVCAIYRAVTFGTPVMRRIVTVSGSGVERPANLYVRLGTSFASVLEYCKFNEQTKKVIMGGPMMGISQYTLETPVVKGTSGILCFTDKEISEEKEGNCIRCGGCVSACPMNLTPNYIAMYTKLRDYDTCEKLNAVDCIECGCCSYTCPSKIPLVQYMRLAKQNVIEKRKREVGKK
ncbi:MAG: electron transport complex subunit RsxC [Clostridia bacterium]|nr:electron transport complex subunit RsxC [Clostridia bacterium]